MYKLETTIPISTIERLVKEHATVDGVVNGIGYILSFTERELQFIYDYYYTHGVCEDLVTIRIILPDNSDGRVISSYDAFIWDYSNRCLAFLFHHTN